MLPHSDEAIIIVGASGLLGQALIKTLPKHRLYLISRSPDKYRHLTASTHRKTRWFKSLNDLPRERRIAGVINLAGATIAQRWNANNLTEIYQSRLETGRALINYVKKSGQRIRWSMQASAIGFYGHNEPTRTDEAFDWYSAQTAPEASGTAADLCRQIEQLPYQSLHCDHYDLRTGIVLSPDGGFIKKLKPIYQLGLGGRIGSGEQSMSFIHVDDWVGAIHHILKYRHKFRQGAINLTAPTPSTQGDFNQTMAQLVKRPAFFHQPEWLVKLLFGKMGEELLLGGQAIRPERLLESGYQFKHPTLDDALKACLSS